MEVEVKARTKDLFKLKSELESKGASFSEPFTQKDTYFKQKGWDKRPEKPGDFIIRIREEDEKKIFTMKELTGIRGAWKEHESYISDPSKMENIITVMGMEKILELNKTRILGSIKKFEICLDSIKELGDFIEVALETNEDNSETNREKILEFMKEIGIDSATFDARGYPEMVLEAKGYKFEGQKGINQTG